MEINNLVIDKNGHIGIITNIFPDTGQIQVKQKENVWCSYDNENQLERLNCIDCVHWHGWKCEGRCTKCTEYSEFKLKH